MIENCSVRLLDDMLFYYGRVQNTRALGTKEWARRIMSIHFFRREEAKEAEKITG